MKNFQLPPLPYAADALSPQISELTLVTHHGKHHKAYLDKVNKAIAGTPKENWSLERLVREASDSLFNHAAQAWNHEFYWHSMRPAGGSRPSAALAKALGRDFGSIEAFTSEFSKAAGAHFGSGWAWLVAAADGKLAVLTTHDAGTPLKDGALPLLTCDLWEHAWYLDRQQDKAAYVKAFFELANWDFAAENLARGTVYSSVARSAGVGEAAHELPKLIPAKQASSEPRQAGSEMHRANSPTKASGASSSSKVSNPDRGSTRRG